MDMDDEQMDFSDGEEPLDNEKMIGNEGSVIDKDSELKKSDLLEEEGHSNIESMDEDDENVIEKDESKQEEAKKLPKTTIRRIDRSKDSFKDKTSSDVCQLIIEKYNNDRESSYRPLEPPNVPMTILVYMEKKEKKSELAKVFIPDSEEKSVVISYIIFIITKNDNIYCLTYGDAHHVVHGFEDTGFARGVAKSVTNRNIKQFGMRNLRGINYAVSNFFRDPTIPERLQVIGVVTNIQSRVNDAILEKVGDLRLNTEVGAIVNISRNGVRFMKDLTLHTMCKQIAWLDDENVGIEGDGSDIMDYIMEVEDTQLQERLEDKMFAAILKCMKKDKSATEEAGNDSPPFDFMYKEYEKHMRGKQFSFHLPKERKISGDKVFESFDDAVNSLRDFLKDALINKFTLMFKCDGGSTKESKLFLYCLKGKVKHEEADFTIDSGKWTKGDEVIEEKSLQETLNKILADHILEDMAAVANDPDVEQFGLFLDTMEEGSKFKQCSFSSNVRKGKKLLKDMDSAKAKQSATDKKLVDLSSYSDALCELKLYLRNNLKVSFLVDEPPPSTDLFLNYFHGEIILDDEAQTGGSRIYHKVNGKWFSYDQQFYKCLQESFKSLLLQKLVTSNDTEINLPEIWPPNIKEEDYSELYAERHGYYIGDKICPYDIELFDIMKVTNNEIYLYHVKENFDKITRVACSQIRNSASVINASRHGGGEKNYLEEWYSKYKKKQKEEQQASQSKEPIEKEEFLKLFQTKRIVFVYAFTKTSSKKDHPSAAKDKVRGKNPAKRAKVSQDSRKYEEGTPDIRLEDCLKEYGFAKTFKSMIARHELHYTNSFLEDLGFDFAICQIPKYHHSEETIDVKKEETY